MKQLSSIAAAGASFALLVLISAVPTTNAGFTRQPTTPIPTHCCTESGDTRKGQASTGDRTRIRAGATASPLFRSVVAISTSGDGGDDTVCVGGKDTVAVAAVDEKQEAAPARRRTVYIPTFEDLQQAYYPINTADLAVDTRKCNAATVRDRGLLACFSLSRVRSALAVTFNAAVAVLAAQHVCLASLFDGSAASTRASSGADFGDAVDIPVPAAAVMRVAPAGASTVTQTAKRSNRLTAEAFRTFAGSGAAVAGTLIGRGYLIKRERENDDEEENGQRKNIAHRKDEIMRTENAERYRRLMSTSPSDGGKITGSGITTRADQQIAQVGPDIYCPAIESADEAAGAASKAESTKERADETENAGITNVKKHKDEYRATTATNLLHDREAAARDFQRMRSLLEARLKMNAAKRNALPTQNTTDAGTELTRCLLKDREAAKRDFQRMRSLLEARLGMEEEERGRPKYTPSHSTCDCVESSPTSRPRDKEKFHRMLLAARIRQDAVDKAAFLRCELEKRERAAAIVEEIIELHRRREVEEMKANAVRTEFKKPSSITPELMDTIQIMQKDNNSHKTTIETEDSGSTNNEKKKRLRFALASVFAFFASSLTSNDTSQI